jgi:predicted DNA-binding transcriptional regulator AlpA
MSTDIRPRSEQTMANDPLLSPDDVSTMLGGVPVRTLKRWRTERSGPVAMHLGRRVVYRWSAVEAWLEQKDREAAAWMAS